MMADYEKFILYEKNHLSFLYDSFISGVLPINGAELIYSDFLSDSDWNYATAFDKNFLTKSYNIDAIISFYRNKNLVPCIYMTPYNYDLERIKCLQQLGFKIGFSDVWMVYQGGELSDFKQGRLVTIKIVQTYSQQLDFIKVFFAAYNSEESDNFYHADESYRIPIERTFRYHAHVNFIPIIAYIDSTPVGCALLAYNKHIAGIYCVGVIPSYRKDGVGKEMMYYLLQQAKKLGITAIFLLTEKNSYAEKFYTKLNFKTEYVGYGFVLREEFLSSDLTDNL